MIEIPVRVQAESDDLRDDVDEVTLDDVVRVRSWGWDMGPAVVICERSMASLGRSFRVLISRARACRGGAVGAGVLPCPGQLEPGVGKFTRRAPPGTGSHLKSCRPICCPAPGCGSPTPPRAGRGGCCDDRSGQRSWWFRPAAP